MMMIAVHKLCSQRYKVQTVKLTLQFYRYKSWWHVWYAK